MLQRSAQLHLTDHCGPETESYGKGANRWRMNCANAAEVKVKMNKFLQGSESPESEEAVFELLTGAGFKDPIHFFASLFWGARLTRRNI
ncbi:MULTISPECIES: hypothetical protein [Klebsiella]|uniref:hypothetical protein n=1 Tax=Klebsiella TaxID=570 RepID=UPI00189079F1|nr:hypothetical protein [Klebsiella variicola]EMD1678598.1 hypothetical protein [Klebsiella variicola]HBU6144316.1 hypothetical protein [Klebsiella variicola]